MRWRAIRSHRINLLELKFLWRLQMGLSQGVVIMGIVFDCFRSEQYLHACHCCPRRSRASNDKLAGGTLAGKMNTSFILLGIISLHSLFQPLGEHFLSFRLDKQVSEAEFCGNVWVKGLSERIEDVADSDLAVGRIWSVPVEIDACGMGIFLDLGIV